MNSKRLSPCSLSLGMYPLPHMKGIYPPPHMTCMYPPPHSFGCELVESQLLPEDDSAQGRLFVNIDLATTALFTVELLVATH